MASPMLLVPMEVAAMLVNDQVRSHQNFQRWSYNYQAMVQSFVSPEPSPFSGNANDFGQNPANNGVYLHWTLPQALRHGSHDTASGATDYPLAPNRWLVLRYSGALSSRTPTAWVIESDFLDPNQGTAPYMDPTATTPAVTSIGRKVNLNNPQWQETGSADLFLTVLGPGNAEFAAYQPYVENVFSIHDTLAGVAPGETLSYLIAGWYSNPARDILTTGDSFADVMQALNWTIAGGEAETPTVSICHGLVLGLEWQNSTLPASRRPADTTNIALAVGNTAIDALTAMIRTQAGTDSNINPELLEAFQYGLVPLLDQPDGALAMEAAIHSAWFGSQPGGYFWEIVDAPANGGISPPPITPQEAASEAQWLAALNQSQAAYDAAALLLADMQWRLYVYWWKHGNAAAMPKYPSGMSPAQFQAELDPTNQQGLLAQATQQIAVVNQLRAQIPWGDTPDALRAAITQYAGSQNLPAGRVLKRGNAGRFYQANNPVVVIKGAEASALLTDDTALVCRCSDQVVTGFTYSGTPITAASLTGGGVPTPQMTNLPAVMANLLTEFFFLDPTNATMVAAQALGKNDPGTIAAVAQVMAACNSYSGVVPAVSLSLWANQPWAPLFLLWQVVYYPISHDSGGTPNWTFDGTSYHWTGNGAVSDANTIMLSGRIFLTPQCSFNFESQLNKYLQQYPNADLLAVEQFMEAKDQWDFLSQSLDGFNQQLALRDQSANLAPYEQSVAATVGPSADYAPLPGASQQVPFQGWPASDFQPWRSGQFYFSRAMVVDRFGQSIEVVNTTTATHLPLIVAEGLQPDTPIKTIYPMVQTPPRLLQPGRLSFNYVSATDDSQILNLEAGVNPVCAWVLPNHLDQSLACFDNQGGALGEVYVITNDQQQQVVNWDPAPGGSYPTIPSLQTDFPHLYQFLSALAAQGPDVFADLLLSVDETLWTIDPLGARSDQDLSVLMGRPLALVRCRLQLQLDGPPISDPSWQYTFSPATPAVPSYQFPIRMGNIQMQQDGLIGYFTGDNYTQFNMVSIPDTGDITPNSYILPIGQNGNYINLSFADQSIAYLTMLMDPRADVHAYTDILPTMEVGLPQAFVGPALAHMAVTFHIGPLLTDLQIPAGSGGSGVPATSVIMPKPSEQNGTWSWLQYDGSQWQPYGIAPADQSVKFTNTPPWLRTGRLQLAGALKSGNR